MAIVCRVYGLIWSITLLQILNSGVKRDGAIKIPGGGRILFDITLLEVEDGSTQTLYQWEPPAPLSWESTQVISGRIAVLKSF